MVIYLRHPKHGTKVAISDGEALEDEKNGWERYSHETVEVVEEKPEEMSVPNVLREKRKYQRKQK